MKAAAVAAALALLSAPAVHAHHSSAAVYDRDKIIEAEGDITEVSWSNPHVRFKMRGAEPGGRERVWEIESNSVSIVSRFGLREDLVAVGAHVKLAGNSGRARDDIRAVLDALKLDRAHIVGLSMGGFATLHFGFTYPERARSLVVGGCGYGAAPDKRAQFAEEAETAAKRFEEIGAAAGPGLTTPRVSRGSAVADIDNDGGLDVVIGNLDGQATLARNVGGGKAGHWLKVRLIGDPTLKTPRDAIGSVVFVTAGGIRRPR